MTAKPLTKREKSVRRHNIATLLALMAFIALVVRSTELVTLPGAVNFVAIMTLFVAIITMFRTRNADEYVAAIWRAGTSTAFIITAAVLIFLPFTEGFIDGLMGYENGQDIDASDASEMVIIASFFIANAWARLRGTA
ncbi:hypothetical protein [Qipengyuania gaetbuli]|uniref:hypothetical protein n=1 Tax=Qipengyuania gaetbuli TaxID=266952 RepID=UPI001CD48724|nr:hypothetical protein [Qipengyuania gaetbuli]MCA0908854.1 hypothetical protein [Qipengyuania gaetbuli]